MATSNITGFSVGQDMSTVLFVPKNGGGVINSQSLGRLLSFDANPVISEQQMTPINNGGVRLVRNIYQGWSGDISFGRYNGNLSLLMGAIMGVFNQIGTETYFNIEAVVFNSTVGTTDNYTFTNAVLSQGSIGNFGETSRVDQRLHFEAQQILINGIAPSVLPTIS